ncbi:uncharacterized protein At4g26485-like, partial [Vitis riparia]|uniref:uncharacterized protein At4g26485-like n=1 Tax=Vitis riparia TaxID=96939 RepID=UPI00155B3B9E
KPPLIYPPRLGSDTKSSSSRPALQQNQITSPPSLGSCSDYTFQTNLRTHPPPPLSSSSFTHSKTSGTSCFQPTLQTLETHQQLSSRSSSTGERWIKHYSSEYKILLVGEGDFSFSASLAVAFASATNITATSLDSIEFLSTNYRYALSNIDTLRSLGAKVMHDVDATKMAHVFPFNCMRFDRVVYNFPLAGFFPNASREDQIRRNQMLVQLFLENAKKMIHIDGEIHIVHKSNGFFLEWNLEFLASRVGLRLVEEEPFNFMDYPGYRTKYGFGGDNNFNCNPSRTYKFGKIPNEKPSYL